MSASIKKVLFLLALLLLCLPMLQSAYPVIKEKPLCGYYRLHDAPDLKTFTWRNWFSGRFQEGYAAATEDHISFRNTLFRINNEADYRLFGTIHAEGFIEGKNGYLFEEDYILEYTGKYFIGKQTIDKKLGRLKWLQEQLKKTGTDLVFVLEPGKASFYPEYIPDHYHPGRKTLSNLDYFIQRFGELNVNYIDLNRYFLLMKDTSRYPLFTKYGMHWSIYGACLAADTLARYIEKTQGVRLPEMKVASLTVSDSLRWTDRDIADMLNLVFPVSKTSAAYPVLSWPPGEAVDSPAVLTVGDSYYINIINDYARALGGRNDYWYYNSKLYPHIIDSDNPVYVDKSSLAEKIRSYRVIFITVSEINLHCGGWNFIDECYEALNPGFRDPWVYRYENNIRNGREWFRYMVLKAKSGHLTTEEMIRRDAEYMVSRDFDKLENKTREDSLAFLARISADSPYRSQSKKH
jgi:hypothetical protein